MRKTQVYLSDADLKELHRLAAVSHRSVASMVREAVQRVWLTPTRRGPIGVWRGPIRRGARDHDSIYDER